MLWGERRGSLLLGGFCQGYRGKKGRETYPVEVSMLCFIWLDHPEQAYWIFF